MSETGEANRMMGTCEPGHEWQLAAESRSYVEYRCSDCGSVCVAPKPVPSVENLVVRGSYPQDGRGAGQLARS
jgi:hypothetical protein